MGSIIPKGRLGEDIMCYLKNGLREVNYGLARVNYTRAAEIVGGGSVRAKYIRERNGSRNYGQE